MAHYGEEYRHWRMEQDCDGIVWLTFDHAERKVNTLSRAALEELSMILDKLSRQLPAGLVVRSGKANGFIAGADITEFTGLADADQALAFIERGQAILDLLERLPFPTVSLIHGFCLGGGLELALACRYRIAADTPETQLGLPEVKLGIHPGFGGTVRLSRLVGPLAALELMVTGRSIDSWKARRIGLVDDAVPQSHFENAARSMLLHPPSPERPGFLSRICQARLLRPLLAGCLRRKTAKRVDKHRYPAPFAIIDLWERYGGDPGAMFSAESHSIAQLITGNSSRNLVRVFLLQERLRSLGRGDTPAPRVLHVIGGGTMGGDIAAWSAMQGLRVTIQDLDKHRLAKVVRCAAALFRKNLREPRMVEAALERLIPDFEGYGLSRADIVIEAIFEDAAAKRQLFSQIELRMRPGSLLATNTSSIPLEELAGALAHPERLVGLHFFNPVAKMQLVEVVSENTTARETLAKATAFVGAIRRLPLPVRSSPGFLVSRILMPYLMEAITIETEGVPTAVIDRVALKFGMPMGPLLLADTVGLDICLSVARNLAAHFNMQPPKRLEDMVSAGRLGMKSGNGFYTYKKGKPVSTGRKIGADESADLEERLLLPLLNETVACWREKIAADADLIDAGVIFGAGFAPFRGGPLRHIKSAGVAFLHERLVTLAEKYGSRFAPDAGWSELPPDDSGGP